MHEGQVPRIVYGEDLRVCAANAAARQWLGIAQPCGLPRDRIRPPSLQPDPIAHHAPLPCSTFLTCAGPDGPRSFLAHYRRRARHLAVRFAPCSVEFAFTAKILDPILVTDHLGYLVHANAAAARLLNAPLRALIGMPALALGASLQLDAQVVASMLRDATTGRGMIDDFILAAPDGRSRHFCIRSSPWTFQGAPCGALWLAAETTHSEHRDLPLVSATCHRLAARYQHALRNSLQTMQAAVDVGRLDDDGRHQHIFDVLNQNVRLMNRFLVAQFQPRGDRPAPARQLSALVEEEIERARLRYTTCGLQITHRRPPAEPPIRVQGAEIARVFANLFRNVAQAKPDAHVEVSYARLGDRLACRVADDGPGFPQRVLSPRWLGHDPTTHLGLAIVIATIESCGGDVSMANAPTGGALVTIRLPLARETRAACTAAAHHPPPRRTARAPGADPPAAQGKLQGGEGATNGSP